MWFLLLPAALAIPLADCKKTFDASEVMEAVGIAEAGFTQVRPEYLESGEAKLMERLACLSEPLDVNQIARIQLILAVTANYRGDLEGAKRDLAGMLAAAPGYDYSQLLPPDHPLRAYIGEAGELVRDRNSRPLRTDKKEKWWIEVDGAAATTVPARRNAILQLTDNQQHLLETRYYHAGDELGAWDPASKEKMPPPVRVEPDAEPAEVGQDGGEPPNPKDTPPKTPSEPLSFRARLGPTLQQYVDGQQTPRLLFGGQLAGGLTAGLSSKLGLLLEVGYRGALGSVILGETPTSSSNHQAFLQGGLWFGSERLRLEVGPSLAWLTTRALVSTPPKSSEIPFLTDDSVGFGTLTTFSPGLALGLSYTILPESKLSLRLDSSTQLVNRSPWFNLGLGVQLGF